jgi:hypothetical protein
LEVRRSVRYSYPCNGALGVLVCCVLRAVLTSARACRWAGGGVCALDASARHGPLRRWYRSLRT